MGQISASVRQAPAASASSASTPTQGLPAPWAMPLTALTPIRTPVNDPGPVTAAYRPISLTSSPARPSASSIMGMRLTECVRRFTAAPS